MTMRNVHRAIGSVYAALVLLSACGSESPGPGSRPDVDADPTGDSAVPPRPPGSTDGGAIADGETTPDSDADPGPPRVQLIGRFDTRDPDGPIATWPGSRIVARFEGTRVSVRLDEIIAPWMEGGPSEWDVAIDDVWGDKLVMKPGQADYVLASGLPNGRHTVELYKRTEAQNGTTQLRGFDFGGGTLLPPPLRRQRRIEMIGDSAVAGYGVEGLGYPDSDCPGLDYSAQWQNFRVAIGQRLAAITSAELFGTVYSGKGLARNIWRPDKETLPVVFTRALAIDATSTWDFTSWIPHVVVIMAGGNDFAIGQPVDDGPASLGEFVGAYRAFVATIRGHYPEAHVFLVLSPSVTDAVPADRYTRTNVLAGIKAVAEQRNAEGDARVYWFVPPLAPPSELTACNGHGNPQFHDRVAHDLALAIKPKIGW